MRDLYHVLVLVAGIDRPDYYVVEPGENIWLFEKKHYDRENARRQYRRDVVRARRHFTKKTPNHYRRKKNERK